LGLVAAKCERIDSTEGASWFKPAANVYASRKLRSTILDESATAFENRPG
jgi:hypothetical protein